MFIDQKIKTVINDIPTPEDLRFGKTVFPIAAVSTFNGTEWSALRLDEARLHSVPVASSAVQYAQSIFEGMKAYQRVGATPSVFRPMDHARRFNVSARRLCIPDIPKELFLDAVFAVSALYRDHIPDGEDAALYLRPTAFGTDLSLTIEPSDAYKFMVLASPTLPFSTEMKSVYIERTDTRSSIGGTGDVKVSGNYSPGFRSLATANQLGCATSLWLDSKERRYIEELSLMNLFFVRDDALITPYLNNSFLPGITRSSIISIADKLNVRVMEIKIDLDELIDGIRSNRVSEAFSCGTAAVVSPIGSLVERNSMRHVISRAPGQVTKRIKKVLTDIQYGRVEDSYGWMQS